MKIKTLKEYLSYMGGFRLGYVDNITPIASLGDVPPKGQAGKKRFYNIFEELQ